MTSWATRVSANPPLPLPIVIPNRLQPVRNLLFRIRRGKQIPRFARNDKGLGRNDKGLVEDRDDRG